MKDEFEKEVSEIETDVSEEKNEKQRINKKGIVKGILIGLIIGLICVCSLTSYRILFNMKKVKFLYYLNSDVQFLKGLTEDIADNTIVKFINDSKAKSVDFGVNLDSNELSGNIMLDNEYIALKLKDINENYLVLENKNLNEFWNKLGLQDYGLASKIDWKSNPLKLTKSEQRKIYNFLTKSVYNILENIDNDRIILNDESSTTINNKVKNFKSIEVSFSKGDIFMIQKEVLLALEKEGIFDLLIKKANKLGNSKTINKKEINEKFEKYLAYLDYAKAYYELEGQDNDYFMVYKMYYNEPNKLVSRELLEKYTYEGSMYEDVVCSVVTADNGYYEIKIFTQEDYTSAYYTIISDKVTIEDNKQNHAITYTIDGFLVENNEEGKEEYAPFQGVIKSNLVIEKLENNVTKLIFNDENNLYSINAEYDDSRIDAKYNSESLKINLELKNETITKDELINNGAVLLNEKTQEEIIREIDNIGNKIMEIFAE